MISLIKSIFARENTITHQQLRHLENYEYKRHGVSVTERLFMTEFWSHLVAYYPIWLAPNVLTTLGLCMTMSGWVILAYFSPDAKTEAPKWIYCLCAIMLFIYQTLDGTDGMHARRINAASALGELFDHGCDSLSQVFVTTQLAACLGMGTHPNIVFCMLLSAVSIFYIAHWGVYVTNVIEFYDFDATEGEFLVIIFFLISGKMGPEFWECKILGVQLNFMVVAFTGSAAAVNIFRCGRKMITHVTGKRDSPEAFSHLISPVIPFLTIVVPPIVIYRLSTDVLTDHMILFCVGCGMVSAKTTMKIILAHMIEDDLKFFDTILLGPILLIWNYQYGFLVSEHVSLCLFLTYGFVNLGFYCWSIANQISGHLKIRCFKIEQVQQDQVIE